MVHAEDDWKLSTRRAEIASCLSLVMNEKGGMDVEEFVKYIQNAIMLLYPDAAPEKGKWVINKCGSSPD